MTDLDNEAEAFKASQEQRRKPLPYPMTEAEKRSYDYDDYEPVQNNSNLQNEG